MSDSSSLLKTATRRAKSDVANKLISMFLHELSRAVSKNWSVKVESENYVQAVRGTFNNHCPYCWADLAKTSSVVEHLEGMNRLRVGLHLAGNVLVSCKRCNNEKRRDDSTFELTLAPTGWESFLSHDGRCVGKCKTCAYWTSVWPNELERTASLAQNLQRIRTFRQQFEQFGELRLVIAEVLPMMVGKLYSDCQNFATKEIDDLLALFIARLGETRIESESRAFS